MTKSTMVAAKSCQTFMIRGLVPNWKQPIYYQFDQPMVKDVLLKIISKLFEANFIVVAIVSDMGTGNVALWRELNVGHDKKCNFAHPCDDSLKIFVWADVPHLIKLVRNHLIDHSFYVDDYIINKDYFQALLKLSSTELTIAHKLTQDHINISGSARQRVRPAVKLLSNTVAKAITYAGGHRLMPKNSEWLEASAIVQLFNDWFDLMNSRSKFVISCPGRNAFGTDIEKQKELLHKMTEVINIIRVGKHKNFIPFQKGIILSNKSLIEMFEYVSEKYKVEYVLTSRLNQDVLENFFPTFEEWGALTTTLLLPFSQKIETLQDRLNHVSLTDSDASILSINTFEEPAYLEDESMNQDLVSLIDQFEIKEKIHMEALKYITDINSVPDWLQTISRGSLLYPNEQLWEVAKTMEEEFYKMHGKSLSKNKSIFHELANQTLSKLKNNSVAFEVILCLSRTRTYIRPRELNRKISFYNCKKKLDKKMSKFTNYKI
nr:unnamed protein product [Callosobruchus chinensis]